MRSTAPRRAPLIAWRPVGGSSIGMLRRPGRAFRGRRYPLEEVGVDAWGARWSRRSGEHCQICQFAGRGVRKSGARGLPAPLVRSRHRPARAPTTTSATARADPILGRNSSPGPRSLATIDGVAHELLSERPVLCFSNLCSRHTISRLGIVNESTGRRRRRVAAVPCVIVAR